MQLRVALELVGDVPVVVLDGVVDLATIPAVRDQLIRAVQSHPNRTVAVDLDRVTAIDDCGLGQLLGAAGMAREAGGDLVLVCSAARLRSRLSATRLDRAIDVQPNVAGIRAPIYHAALPADWLAAAAVGVYTVSTRGVTLEHEGFIHCSYRHQVEGVANMFYADLDELTLLTIDAARLASPVVDELPAPDAPQAFTHIYGPIPIEAVVAVTPWPRDADGIFRLP